MSKRQAWQPPFSVELLADLHAGNIGSDTGADLRLRVQRDSDAIAVLEALDAVRSRLSELGADAHVATPIPDTVAARIERDITEQSEPLRNESGIRRTTRHPRGRLALAAAGVVILAVAAITLVLGIKHPHTNDVAGHTSTSDLSTRDVMTAMNHNDVHGRLATPTATTACLRALGVNAAPLGSADIRFRGRNAVLFVVPSATPGKVSALVVTPQCAPGAATLLARTDF